MNEFCQEKGLEISYKGMDGCVTCVIAKRIPLFIISFNRLNTLKGMVEYLSKEPRVEVIIVDNCSTYKIVQGSPFNTVFKKSYDYLNKECYAAHK